MSIIVIIRSAWKLKQCTDDGYCERESSCWCVYRRTVLVHLQTPAVDHLSCSYLCCWLIHLLYALPLSKTPRADIRLACIYKSAWLLSVLFKTGIFWTRSDVTSPAPRRQMTPRDQALFWTGSAVKYAPTPEAEALESLIIIWTL